jgi:hypothetical protein
LGVGVLAFYGARYRTTIIDESRNGPGTNGPDKNAPLPKIAQQVSSLLVAVGLAGRIGTVARAILVVVIILIRISIPPDVHVIQCHTQNACPGAIEQ